MPNIQIKRYTGSAWENVNPRTLAQNIFNAAGDTAIFDGNDKIKIGYLPDAVFDSLYFYGVVSSAPNSLHNMAISASSNAATLNRSPLGYYWVASQTVGAGINASPSTAVLGSDGKYYKTFLNPSDDGTSGIGTGVTLEAGDWIVITKIAGGDGSSAANAIEVSFGVIENTYELATTTADGIVRLSDETIYANLSGNHAITEGVLKTVIDQASFASSSHTHTVANITDITATGSEINVLDGMTSTTAELNTLDGFTGDVNDLNYAKDLRATGVTSTEFDYLDGVTDYIQTQLNGKQATITGGASSIVSSNLTASRALVSDGSGKVAVSAVTSTELGYLDGVTSAIQTQLNTLSGRVRVYYDGTPSGMATDDIWFDAV